MAYVLRSFTPDRVDEVSAAWREIAGEDEFEVELAGPFAWCVEHIQHKEGDGHARELYNDDTGCTDAILEVVNSRGEMSKLLKLYVSPEFWGSDDNPETENRVVELHAEAYGQLIRAGIGEGMRRVKIYGRTDRMFRLLSLLRATWQSDLIKWDAKMEGRWLTLTNRT